ncbi:MAG: hydantoinase B/oxoprolinase family protein, partial [Pseudomonadales bacterium]|nr:hydantoinase B/oxoprolinase family protein [Pseudomonadales bacterium]
GGTHLPDVTVIAPVFARKLSGTADETELICFVANRAHHANIGATTPGSMPLSNSMDQEGLVIPPSIFVRKGKVDEKILAQFTGLPGANTTGDFAAQMSANRIGIERLRALVSSVGLDQFMLGIGLINDYGEKLARSVLRKIPDGRYHFSDLMDDDGFGHLDVVLDVNLAVSGESIILDFSGSSKQVEGNINCPVSVVAAAVFYAFRCLLPEQTPNCAGTFRCISIGVPAGSVLNAERPAATAAGNVETSMRIVDVVLGALSKAVPNEVPAASQGTMNNVAMGARDGDDSWDYYETIAGGMGASESENGHSGVQCHMTNTLNTPIESLESHFPIRIMEYALRENSGGQGVRVGGDGLIREFLFLEPTELTLLTERRRHSPWGLFGGEPGARGKNSLDGRLLPGKCHERVNAGQVLRIETPGGGGYGQA